MCKQNLPIIYWGDAFLTIAFNLNRVPSNSVTITLYEYKKLGPIGRNYIFIIYYEQLQKHLLLGEQHNDKVTKFDS